MARQARVLTLLAGVALLAASTFARQAVRVPWEGDWRIEAGAASVERYQGRDALRLHNGSAWLDAAAFRDGVVRFDLNATGELGFYGLSFRAADDGNYEHIYLRPFLSGKSDATQYTPVFNGVSGWQLYADERFTGAVSVPTDRWVQVEIRIRGTGAELRVDGQRVVFPALQREPAGGAIAITAAGSPARFANVSVSRARPELGDPAVAVERADVESAANPGQLTGWVVSTAFAEDSLPATGPLPDPLLESLDWARTGTDVRGIVNLARTRTLSPAANTVLAGVTLRSDAARLVRLRFGFSDRVTVYLDRRPVYRGSDGWRSRDYRFLGTVGLFDELILPLRRGDNVLRFAVSEDFGGWGVTALLPDPGIVEVLAR